MNDEATPVQNRNWHILDKYLSLINHRAQTMPEQSYVTHLLENGGEKAFKKYGEESIELLIELVRSDQKRIVSEGADMLFHLLVCLVSTGIEPQDILDELEKRFRS